MIKKIKIIKKKINKIINKINKKIKCHVGHVRMSCNHANMQKLPERRLKWDRVCLDEPKWAKCI